MIVQVQKEENKVAKEVGHLADDLTSTRETQQNITDSLDRFQHAIDMIVTKETGGDAQVKLVYIDLFILIDCLDLRDRHAGYMFCHDL